MIPIRNGMSATLLDALGDSSVDSSPWRKSSYSGRVGNCVELAWLPDEQVAVRNSRDPSGPALITSRAYLAALVATAKTW